jgi:hypothetical protein
MAKVFAAMEKSQEHMKAQFAANGVPPEFRLAIITKDLRERTQREVHNLIEWHKRSHLAIEHALAKTDSRKAVIKNTDGKDVALPAHMLRKINQHRRGARRGTLCGPPARNRLLLDPTQMRALIAEGHRQALEAVTMRGFGPFQGDTVGKGKGGGRGKPVW